MSDVTIRRALLSVSDKAGLIELGQALGGEQRLQVGERIDRMFEGKYGFFNTYFGGRYDRAAIVEGLGTDLLGSGTLYKRWPCVGTAHSHMKAAIDIVTENNLALGDIAEIRLHVGDYHDLMCQPLPERRAPATLADAKELMARHRISGVPVVESVDAKGSGKLVGILTNRDLRKTVMSNTLIKGARDNENDNRPVLLEIVRLRAEKAALLGHPNHASYVLEEQTAGNTANVHAMLRKIAPAAVRNAKAEAADIQATIDAECAADGSVPFQVASWAAVQTRTWSVTSARS